ncbi:MAG: DotG/IcmE/VirB10 family protein [Desulfovibrio sp.]|nr:DotG/IcmE/VirB10 family protein [Desulfovibrio sp.]
MFTLIGALAVTVGLLFFTIVFSPEKPSSSAEIAGARSDVIKAEAGGEGSEEYNRKLHSHDAQQADAALKAGESFVPTPVGKKAPLVGKKEETPPAPPPVAPVRTMPVQPPRTNDAMLKRMMEDLSALDTKLSAVSAGTGQLVYLKDFSEEKKPGVSTSQRAEVTPTEAETSSPLGIKPGDLLYAVVDTGVNSDVPSAVMATVASGQYKNARLLGSFQRHDERLVLAFNRAVLPSGETVQLEAYAVDPGTSEASVASRVDTHFFSRWGGLIASAFLEGLGTAKRYSGAQSTTYGTYGESTDQMVWNSYSLEDQAWIAAGKVGEKAGKIFEKGFDRPPTVYLKSGTAIGVLVLNVKDR